MKFRLIAGAHTQLIAGGKQTEIYQCDPRKNKFPVIKTDRDLTKLFGREKFEQLHDEALEDAPDTITTMPGTSEDEIERMHKAAEAGKVKQKV